MIDDYLDEPLILVKIKDAMQSMDDIESGKAKQRLENQIAELQSILSERSNSNIDGLRFELDKAVDVLRIFRKFLEESPGTVSPESKFFRDSTAASHGQGLYKIIDYVITAYDIFMAHYDRMVTS